MSEQVEGTRAVIGVIGFAGLERFSEREQPAGGRFGGGAGDDCPRRVPRLPVIQNHEIMVAVLADPFEEPAGLGEVAGPNARDHDQDSPGLAQGSRLLGGQRFFRDDPGAVGGRGVTRARSRGDE